MSAWSCHGHNMSIVYINPKADRSKINVLSNIKYYLYLFQEHNASCPFFILNCNNVCCDVQVIRQELEDHLTKCEHRTVVCEHCSSEHMFKDKDVSLNVSSKILGLEHLNLAYL